jgi:hypothetical protein
MNPNLEKTLESISHDLANNKEFINLLRKHNYKWGIGMNSDRDKYCFIRIFLKPYEFRYFPATSFFKRLPNYKRWEVHHNHSKSGKELSTHVNIIFQLPKDKVNYQFLMEEVSNYGA